MKMLHEPVLAEVLQCARICHEVNRAYCFQIGDSSQPKWDNAPEWQRATAIAGVRAHVASGLTLTGEQSHESWLAAKKADGWRYGEVKDTEKKRHPCFVPYNRLPAEQRTKDWLFRAAVHAYFVGHFGD